MIKVGLLGYTNAAIQYHLPCYRNLDGVNVAYVADSNESRLQNARKSIKCDDYLQSYQEIFEKKDVDLIDISLRSSLNPQLCLEAAKNGKNFIVEPPFAINTLQGKEIQNVVDKNRVHACIAQSYRFKPSVYPIVTKHEIGEIGRIFAVSVAAFELSPRLNKPLELIKMYSEAADALTFFGGAVNSVHAKTPTFFNDPEHLLEPEIRALITFENSCTGFFNWSGYAPCESFNVDVYGTGGVYKMDIMGSSSETVNWWLNPGPRLKSIKRISFDFKNLFKRYGVLADSGYPLLFSRFLQSIEKDAESPVSLKEGLKSVALIESIKHSIKEDADISASGFDI